MSVIHQIVDKVYVINLDKDKDRMLHMDTQCKQHQINYVRFPAILGSKVEHHPALSSFCQRFCTDGAKGCALSHRGIWEDMMKNNVTTALILEDDGIFVKDFDYRVSTAIQKIPSSYDIIYLNSTYNPKNANILSTTMNTLAGVQPEDHTPDVKKTKGGLGLAAYIIHIDFIRKIIDKPITNHIDYQLTLWIQEFNANAYTFTQYAVTSDQNPFESNLAEKYPIGLNSLLKWIKFDETPDLAWIFNENLIKLGFLNLNLLLLFVLFLAFLSPRRYWIWLYGWILFEGILAKDIQNTLRYGFILSIGFLLQSMLRRKSR